MKSVVLSAAPFGRTRIEYFDTAEHSAYPPRNNSHCLHNETIEYNIKSWLRSANVHILPRGYSQLELDNGTSETL